MEKTKKYQFVGFAFTSVLGTLLHFLYDFFPNSIVACFSAVNESTWEHMKLMYFPLLIFALIESKLLKDLPCFWLVKLKGVLISLCLIPILFYTYRGILGFNLDWINISIFFISAAVGFIFETRSFIKNKAKENPIYFVVYFVIGVLFVVFTFYTPKLGIFLDPLSQSYGIG